jgi:nicotinate-nucleotide--dimethylbenzimidazole phosphoribosyltransferase
MNEFTADIRPVHDEGLEREVRKRLDNLTKPPGSLGRLEEIAVQYCLCRGTALPSFGKMAVYTFAGDHGITEERITPYPKEVTRQMVLNMACGGAAASVMCRAAGIEYHVVDMGVDTDFDASCGVMDLKAGRGTANICTGPAMSPQRCMTAVKSGFELAGGSGADLVGVGEMGIGNSSSAAALYSLFLGVEAVKTVGAGTGSTGQLYERKVSAVRRALALHRPQWDSTPLDGLRRLGGFEICGMTGAILGAASRRIPVVVDGFIAGAAGMVASRISPHVRGCIFYSHASAENFHREFLRIEGVKPILDLDMRLGEGTGAILAMQIISQAMACYNGMATFDSAGVSNKSGRDSG